MQHSISLAVAVLSLVAGGPPDLCPHTGCRAGPGRSSIPLDPRLGDSEGV